MKRFLTALLAGVLVIGAFTACDTKTASSGDNTIKVWSFTDELPRILDVYKEAHPDFPYEFETTVIATTDGLYQPALDQALLSGVEAPDIYAVEAAFVIKYTQGDAAEYAMPYSELGIEDSEVEEAEIATYAVDIGTNEDGALVGLPFQQTGGAFIYRRSIAEEVFGSDDPETVHEALGTTWDDFFAAADKLKEAGYAIISGDGDVYHPLENSSEQGWIVDGKFHIDPNREAFLDISKRLSDDGYSNITTDWQDPWFADMQDASSKKVFGFYGPAWFINYTLAPNSGGTAPGEGTYGDWGIAESNIPFFWGGTWVCVNKNTEKAEAIADIIRWITVDTAEDGMQYQWANGTLFGPGGTKDAVASGVVMEKSNGELDFLGGQNMFDIFVPAGANATGTRMTQYDEAINIIYRDLVRIYAAGQATKEETLANFKQNVFDQLGIEAE